MKIRDNKKLTFLIAALAFFAISTSIYFWSENYKLRKDNNYHLRVVDNCMHSLKVSDELIDNCNAAYTEMSACFSNLDTCNLSESTTRLQSLNEEKQASETRLQELTAELKLLVGEAVGR